MAANWLIFAANVYAFLLIPSDSDRRFALATIQARSLSNALQLAQEMVIWPPVPVYKNPPIVRCFAASILQ